MHIFRRHTFRKLASILTLSLLLGGTASVWASVENLLENKQVETAACHMQMKDKQHASGHCCADSGDCMNLCGNCSVPATASVPLVSIFSGVKFTRTPVLFTLSYNIPDGTSSGLLYRPPIFRA